tara:strand:+ start:715 stop:879 length:165 start_codon:yes stop_codon:yes gene_type:complete
MISKYGDDESCYDTQEKQSGAHRHPDHTVSNLGDLDQTSDEKKRDIIEQKETRG